MKKLLLLFSLITLQNFCFSQTEFCNMYKLDSIINIESDATFNIFRHQVTIVQYNNEILISLDAGKDCSLLDTLSLFKFNVSTNEINTIKCINFNAVAKKLQNPKYSNICFNDSRIFIYFFKSMLLFKKTNSGLYEYENIVKLNHSSLINECLYNDIMFNVRVNHRGNKISTVNLKNNKQKLIISPELTYPLYASLGPSNFIDINKKHILFSDLTENNITVYNYKGKIVQYIPNQKLNWNNIPEDYIPKKYMKQPWVYFAEMDTSMFSKVNFINYISETEFIVNYNLNYNEDWETQADIWKYDSKTKKYILTKENIKCPLKSQIEDNRVFNESNYPIEINSINNLLIFTDSTLVSLRYDAPINPIGLTHKEYMKQRDEYLLMNNPVIQMYIYKRK